MPSRPRPRPASTSGSVMNVLDDLRKRLQDVYAETEVFLNEACELDPFGAAFVNWNGIAAALDAFEAEHPHLHEHEGLT